MKVEVEFIKDIPDSSFKKGDVKQVSRGTAHQLFFYKLAKDSNLKKTANKSK